MIKPAFRKLLTDPAGPVAELTEDRVYTGSPRQNERRARIVLTVTSAEYDHCFDGPSGVVNGTVQVACLGPTDADVQAVATAARKVLDGYEGSVRLDDGGGTVAFDLIEIADQADIESVASPGQPQATHGVALTANFQLQQETE